MTTQTKATYQVFLLNEKGDRIGKLYRYEDFAEAEEFASNIVGWRYVKGIIARSIILKKTEDDIFTFEGEFTFSENK